MTGIKHEAISDGDSLTPHTAKRGDEIESWIKRHRDEYQDINDHLQWRVLDNLLDDYRLHADTGTPLSGEVQER